MPLQQDIQSIVQVEDAPGRFTSPNLVPYPLIMQTIAADLAME
jgi:hypothetical protein